MAIFIENPKFRLTVQAAFAEFVIAYSLLARKVIETERFWDNWHSGSTPFRDIVDTDDLNQSMQITKQNAYRYSVSWSTYYVLWVYFGHALASGERIPPRKWAEIAIEENPLLDIFRKILEMRLRGVSLGQIIL